MAGISKAEKERRTNVQIAMDNIQTEISITRAFLRQLAQHLQANDMDGQAGNCSLRAEGLSRALVSLDSIR